MVLAILRDQFGEEAARDQGMDADAQATALARSHHAGGLDRMVELIDAGGDPLDKEASGLGEPDASGVALEQERAKLLLQRPDPCADAGLGCAECLGGAVEAEIFGDGERLDQRCEGDARS